MTKSSTRGAWPLAGTLAAAVFATAAAAQPAEVVVDLTTLTASGSFAGARYSADTRQYITCRTQVIAIDAAPYVVCDARDSQDRTLTCISAKSAYVDAVLSGQDYDEVRFQAEVDANGVKRCVRLEVGRRASLVQ